MDGTVIFANCSVEYSGRGISTLAEGIYLLIIKPDGSFMVHSSRLLKPRNYMGPGSKITMDGNDIIVRKKRETIKVAIKEKIYDLTLANWDDNEVIMERTESELVNKLITELRAKFAEDDIIREYDTKSLGLIDVLRIDSMKIYHTYEVKRKTSSIASVSQILRYVEHLKSVGHDCRGYLVAPGFTDNALKYAASKDITMIVLDF